MKRKLGIFILIAFMIMLCGCGSNTPSENPIVTMTIKDYGTIKIELYPSIAPNTVANFVNLIESGFYDNNTIHRVQKDFVIQGGDPTGTGTGGPGYTIEGEFKANNYTNNLSHTTGVISMARSSSYDSAGSQFFIVTSDSAKASLDGKYAAFGKVIEGLDIIEKINNDTFEYTNTKMGILKNPLTIESATVDTFGYTYEVKKITD